MEKIKRGQIESWYDHKNIFITGATGFMGKVLLEKVLRSLPNVGKLYILVRPKYGVSSQERINKIFKQLPVSSFKKKIYIHFQIMKYGQYHLEMYNLKVLLPKN